MKTRLAYMIENYIAKHNTSIGYVAIQMDLSQTTLRKFLKGEQLSTESYTKISTWLLQEIKK